MPPPAIPGLAPPSADPHLVVARASDLGAIRHAGVNLVVWTRPAPPGLSAFLATLPAARLPRGRVDVPSARVRSAVSALVRRHLPATSPGPRLLVDDVVRLAALFAEVSGSRVLRIRLDRIDGDGCRLFHHDAVGLRLLCTYRGAGTEWVPDHAVRRDAIGTGAGNDAISPDPGARRRLAPFHVGLFKGEAFPGNGGRGIVHRSPPPAPGDPVRLLLCVDEGHA